MAFNPFRRKPDSQNSALIHAIVNLATHQSSGNYQRFYQELLKSNLIIAEEAGESGPILLEDETGNITLPVFTDAERVKHVYPDAERIASLPAQSIFQLAVKSEYHKININPERGPGGILTFDEFVLLANGQLPDVSSADSHDLGEGNFVPMGDSKLPSEEVLHNIIEKAKELMAQETSITIGFVILMRSKTGKSQLTLALGTDPEVDLNQMTHFSQNFVDSLETVAQQPIGMMWLDDKSYKAISINSQPFYLRED